MVLRVFILNVVVVHISSQCGICLFFLSVKIVCNSSQCITCIWSKCKAYSVVVVRILNVKIVYNSSQCIFCLYSRCKDSTVLVSIQSISLVEYMPCRMNRVHDVIIGDNIYLVRTPLPVRSGECSQPCVNF